MSASAELQTVIRTALLADAAVTAAVGQRVYDAMPAAGQYPCITFGPSSTAVDSMTCIDWREETVQLDVWTTADQGKIWPCKAICDAICKTLNLASIALTTNALAVIMVESVRVMRDPDGITVHGIVTVTAAIEAA